MAQLEQVMSGILKVFLIMDSSRGLTGHFKSDCHGLIFYSNTICPVYIPMEQVKNRVDPAFCAGIFTCTVPVSGSN